MKGFIIIMEISKLYETASEKLNEAKEIGGIPEVVVKACVDFANTHICTKPFVTNAEGAEMSIGSVMVANGCGNF